MLQTYSYYLLYGLVDTAAVLGGWLGLNISWQPCLKKGTEVNRQSANVLLSSFEPNSLMLFMLYLTLQRVLVIQIKLQIF